MKLVIIGKEQRDIISKITSKLLDNHIRAYVTGESAFTFGYYVSPIYDYTKCDMTISAGIADNDKVIAILRDIEDLSVGVDNIEDDSAVLSLQYKDIIMNLFIFYCDNIDALFTSTMRGGYLLPVLDNLVTLLVNKAEKGQILPDRPLGYSKVLAPSSYIYHTLAIHGLYKDELARSSIEAIYKLSNFLTLESVKFPELNDDENDKVRSWLEDVFSATWEEKYRG